MPRDLSTAVSLATVTSSARDHYPRLAVVLGERGLVSCPDDTGSEDGAGVRGHEDLGAAERAAPTDQADAVSPYYRTKLRGLYTTAKADAEAECNILRRSLDKIAEIKSLLEERRIAAKIAGLYHDSEPPRKTMRRGVLMTLLQQSAMTLPLWIGKPGEKPPPLCGAIPASSDYVAKPGDKVAARVKAVDGDEQWILAEVVSYSHAANKYEVDDIDEEGKERHTLSRRRIIPLPQWKANPETDPEALFQKDQLVLALYPQTTCFYRALIHTPPQRPQDDYSVLFEDTSYADGYSPPLNVAQRYVVACKEPKKK
ncbi:SAGA-associated factor 29 isoform X1 [Bufo bufo]|uniref:SAGA-associated factor 29 isoform X1 n=1 Tax=Bufo bufo TaxID=8384 RepID=UPI001ABEBE67|nr:SAGA-associated factor 29 isoform X1 [Bufo bufo]